MSLTVRAPFAIALLVVACGPPPAPAPEPRAETGVASAAPAAPDSPDAVSAPAPPSGVLFVRANHGFLACTARDPSTDRATCRDVALATPPAMLSVVRDLLPRYIVPREDGSVVLWRVGGRTLEPVTGLTYDVTHEQQVGYMLDDGSAISFQHQKTGDDVRRFTTAGGWSWLYHASTNAYSFAFGGDGRHLYSHNASMNGEATKRTPADVTTLQYAPALGATPRTLARGETFWAADFADGGRIAVWIELLSVDTARDTQSFAIRSAPLDGGASSEVARLEAPAHRMFFGELRPFNMAPWSRTSYASRWMVVGEYKDRVATPYALRVIDLRGERPPIRRELPDQTHVAQPFAAGSAYARTRRAGDAVVIERREADSVDLTVWTLPGLEEVMRARIFTGVIDSDYVLPE